MRETGGRWGCGRTRDYSVRRNAAKGRKKFLTCLRYMRTQEFPLLHKSFRSGKADTTYPLSRSVLPISPPCPTSYPPFKRRCIPALYHIHAATAAVARWGVARCLPLSRGRGLYFRLTVKVNGATSRGELARLTGTPNHNFNAYAYARVLYKYIYICVPKLRNSLLIFEDERNP